MIMKEGMRLGFMIIMTMIDSDGMFGMKMIMKELILAIMIILVVGIMWLVLMSRV